MRRTKVKYDYKDSDQAQMDILQRHIAEVAGTCSEKKLQHGHVL